MWYEVKKEDNKVEIIMKSKPENRFWTLDDIRENPLPDVTNGDVCISGNSAVWIYAYTALFCVRNGARSVSVFNALTADHYTVHPLRPNIYREHPDMPFAMARQPDGRYYLEFKNRDDWSEDDLDEIVASFNTLPENSDVAVSLKGPNWLLAIVGVLCEMKNSTTIEYNSILDGQWIDLRDLTARPYRQKPRHMGLSVGIVGDPNSGKSVLSAVLEHVFEKMHYVTWRIDGDVASQTSQWYLSNVSNRSENAEVFDAGAARDSQKLSWTHDMEKRMADFIRNARSFQDILIVDLPGGIHSDGKPSQRIPQGREVMFEDIDAIIILGRSDRPEAEKGWKEELTRIGKDSCIAGVLISEHPDQNLAFTDIESVGEVFRGKASGLDREHLADRYISPVQPELLGEVVKHIVNVKHDGDIAEIGRALDFATKKHANQRRKNSDTPYINHPVDLVRFLTNEADVTESTVLCAALLHDTVEDTETTHEEIQDRFGTAVSRIVGEVTDDTSLPKGDRKRRQVEKAIKWSREAGLVKAADCVCNLRSVVNAPPGWEAGRYAAYLNWVERVFTNIAVVPDKMKDAFDRAFERAVSEYGQDEGDFSYDDQ